jgi:periplasmic divalent cation tolerance protein
MAAVEIGQRSTGDHLSQPRRALILFLPSETFLSMDNEVLLVFITFASVDEAKCIASALVSEKLAACVSLLPGVESFYRWEGALQSGGEILGLIKTTTPAYPALQIRIRELHSYQVPEILAIPVSQGLPTYLDWVRSSCLG